MSSEYDISKSALKNYYITGPIIQSRSVIINTIQENNDGTMKIFSLVDFKYKLGTQLNYLFVSADTYNDKVNRDLGRQFAPGPLLINFRLNRGGTTYTIYQTTTNDPIEMTSVPGLQGNFVLSPVDSSKNQRSEFIIYLAGSDKFQTTEIFAGYKYRIYDKTNDREVSFNINNGSLINEESFLCLDNAIDGNIVSRNFPVVYDFYFVPLVWNYQKPSSQLKLKYTSAWDIYKVLFGKICRNSLINSVAVQIQFILYLDILWFCQNFRTDRPKNNILYENNTLYLIGTTTQKSCSKDLLLKPCDPNFKCGDQKSSDNSNLGCIGECDKPSDVCEINPFGKLGCINKTEQKIIHFVGSFLGKSILLGLLFLLFSAIILIYLFIRYKHKKNKIENKKENKKENKTENN